MTTVIQDTDDRPLLSLPTWMPGSLRTAGYERSLWYALWDSISQTYLPILNAVIDFSNGDPMQWTGSDEAEQEFLAVWTPDLSTLRRTKLGTETDADRLERLLTLRTLLPTPYPASERTLGWALTAALGLALRVQTTMGSLPPDAFIPVLEAPLSLDIVLSGTDPYTLAWRQHLGDTSLLIASQALWRRPPRAGFPACGYSPWGRAGSMPLLDPDLHALGDNIKANAVKDTRNRGSVLLSFPARPYDVSVRPELYSADAPVEALVADHPVTVRTTSDAILRGDTDLHVPGRRLPAPRWRQASPPMFSPSWSQPSQVDTSAIAPPFDLDTDASQPSATSAALYGTGTPVSLPVNHPLIADYA